MLLEFKKIFFFICLGYQKLSQKTYNKLTAIKAAAPNIPFNSIEPAMLS